MGYRFETLQLHVGQEQADVATDARAVPIYRMCFTILHMPQPDLDLAMRETSMED